MDSKIIILTLLKNFWKSFLNPQISLLWILSFSITKSLFKPILLILNCLWKHHLKYFKNTNASKAAGLDNLSGRFLKDAAKVLAKRITDLWNFSITSGKFPDSCKIAKLKSIYKKGSLTEASNYRPISLLPLISKVIKKVIDDQTSVFLNSRNCYVIINLVFAKIIPLTTVSPF